MKTLKTDEIRDLLGYLMSTHQVPLPPETPSGE